MSSKSVNAIKRYRTARLAKLITRSYYLHKRKRDAELYTVVCNEFVSLGGVYVKFLQGVLLRSTMMQKWHNPERMKIFENLDTEPIDVVAILRKEINPHDLKDIAFVQPQSFAAGSFGQVYYAQHVNGKPIIIKVLRPMVRELLRYDLRLLTMFSKRFYSKLSPNMDVAIDGAVRDFIKATMRETDYVEEANFANELYEYYKDHPNFVVPKTYMNLCSKNIITQDFVDGLSVAQIVKLQEQGVDPQAYVREQIGSNLDKQLETLGYEAINGIFNLPRIQGDPHPGNIRLMKDNKVGVIDFGISAATPPNKAAFYGLLVEWNQMYKESHSIVKLFEQFMRFFVSDLYRALHKLSTMSKNPEHQSNFTNQVGQVAQESFTKSTGGRDITTLLRDGKILHILNQMINKDNRFGLIMKLEATEMLRAAQTYITLVDSLGRKGIVLPKVFDRVVHQVAAEHPEIVSAGDDSMSAGDAIDTVTRWLERVAERDPNLFSQLIARIRISGVQSEMKKVSDA